MQRATRPLVVLAVLAFVSTARAEPPRVATLEADPALAHALGVALASWHAEIVPVAAQPPGPDMTEAVPAAQRLARDARASALLWIARGDAVDGGAAAACSLWIYDPRTRQITVRPLTECPPYDDAGSAAVALTVKTVLRDVLASTATEETPPPPPPPPQGTEAPPPAPPPPPPKHTVRLEGFVAGRIPTHAADPVAARFGVEATWFPLWLRGYAGIAASFDGGPAVDVSRPQVFSGTYGDMSISLTARGRLPVRSWAWVEAGLGPGLHFTSIEGSSQAGDVSGHVDRANVSIDALLAFEAAWKWLRVGPFLGASFLLQSQRYHLGADLVLDVPVAQAELGVRVGVELP